MRRPGRIWLAFAIGVSALLAAMAWLTVKAVELDRAELLARRLAEQEENFGRALWRIDSFLTPLLAQEAARPDFVYRPTYYVLGPTGESTRRLLSPLLSQPPAYTRLHFVLHADGRITSPQSPVETELSWTTNHGASLAAVQQACEHLDELRVLLSHRELIALLPEDVLPNSPWELAALEANFDGAQKFSANEIIASPYSQLGDESPPTNPVQTSGRGQQQQVESPQQQSVNPFLLNQNLQLDNERRSGNASAGASRSQRGDSDLQSREAALRAFAQRAVSDQRNSLTEVVQRVPAIEGVSRPLWVGEHLIVARRVQIGRETVVQGCWLDWPALRDRLRQETADLLPTLNLDPISPTEPVRIGRLLATLPVQISAPPPSAQPAWNSPLRLSLAFAWFCLLAASLAAGGALHYMIAVDERRGAFVSAVTHELRTPLTTFRMYAEMLAEDMVPSAEQRQKYLDTLKVEADRLAHLVDNVLQYARLERSRPGKRRQVIAAEQLLGRLESRLRDRAEQSELELVLSASFELLALEIWTDPAAVEQIIFNLVDNACKYAAGSNPPKIELSLTAEEKSVAIVVRDYGPGLSLDARQRLFEPFSKSVQDAANSAPGVGLGLALSRRLASDLSGSLTFDGGVSPGAAFRLRLPRKSP